MSDQQTPQEIGTRALAKALEYADKADRLANATFSSVKQNADHIAIYGGLATVYADVAKAAAAFTTDNV
ncbi:hypothetical protein [Streptomyces sp. ADI98-10]|uniref:hypothetical protein n=1 Tax=Streptomyces sp. ADI98-10 TaxID=1522763 RepID=UPI000FA1584C|nr:hypothetical protein [Streptomyces sp. ADI98-10]RPK93788.1 hypothetical protein EES46_04905 [Streptomyces sp. ADI98-10]